MDDHTEKVDDHAEKIKAASKPVDVSALPPDKNPAAAAAASVTTDKHSVAMPTTTSEQDRSTYGQRRVNLIWESTQAIIAVTVTFATLFVSSQLALSGNADQAAFLLLSNAFFLVIGFYFGRTNHSRVGGVDTTRRD